MLLTQREGLVRERNRLKNRLHVLLPYAYPQYATFFCEPFGKTAVAFWEMYPSPAALAGICVSDLASFLQGHSNYYHGRAKAVDILEKATAGAVERPFQAELDYLIQAHIGQFKQLQVAIDRTEVQMARLVKQTGQQLQTLPGVQTVIAAELLVGIGDVNRFATPDKLAKYAGIAPKEWSSVGKGDRTRSDHGRRALLSTFYHIAVVHICINKNGTVRCPQSRAYFEKKLHEGKSKKAALISLMRVLVRIVWRMLKQNEPYWKLLGREVA